jgi:micrococcal nuclease
MRRTLGCAALLALALAGASGAAPLPEGLLHGTVVHVVDGDTVDVALPHGRTRVRLIGIDAPEMHDSPKLDRDVARSGRSRAAIVALGREATAFTERRLLGRAVGLELDVAHHDKYGRLLAYVWLDDGSFFNAEMMRAGQAQLMTVPPNVRHLAELRRLQHEARDAKRGLWASEPATRTRRRRRRHHARPSTLHAVAPLKKIGRELRADFSDVAD